MMTHFLVLPPLQYYSVAPSCDLYTFIYYRIHKGTKSPSVDMFATTSKITSYIFSILEGELCSWYLLSSLVLP